MTRTEEGWEVLEEAACSFARIWDPMADPLGQCSREMPCDLRCAL